MGASYSQPVTQWSKQEYFGANNTGEDDIAIIGSLGNGNDFGLKADDHGDTVAAATALSGQQVNVPGVIETRADVDVFSFTTGGGAISFIANGAKVGPNLDIELTLRDSSDAIVARDNVATALGAGFDANVAAGTYTVEVSGAGVGNPGVNPPSGYSDYASIGQYTLLGNTGSTTPPTDTTAPARPAGLTASYAGGDITLSWNANNEGDLASYAVGRSDAQAGPFATIGTVGSTTTSFVDTTVVEGTRYYVVAATDRSGNTSSDSDIAIGIVPPPPVPTNNAAGETPVAGTVTGTFSATTGRGGAVQTITEIDSGGKPSTRHDLAEHRWTIPASTGNQTLTVVASASDGGDADLGFDVTGLDLLPNASR
ncbi:MAG: hypothetical protein WKF60_09190, partial [Ilumatobacter sp.]